MECTDNRRRLSTTLPPSPPLLRSRSTTPATATLPVNNNHFCSPNSCHRVNNYRPKSASKSRPTKNDENIMIPSMTFLSTSQKIKPQENARDNINDQAGFAKFLQRRSTSSRATSGAAKGAKSVTNSPSAWAFRGGSPARPESPGFGGKIRVKGGGVGGVLKYFKQGKVSPPLEEEFHRFRVLHNRLLQWRFVNARGEAAMASLKRIAEAKLFSIWVRIFKMRKTIVEKKIQMQRLKLEIKSYQIINPQMSLLNEWSRLERKNQESVSRLARKLLGLSVRLPLVQGAKADVVCLYEVLTTAMGVMDSIEAMIAKFISKQIETTLYLLTELRSMLEQEDEYLEELEMAVPLLRALLAKEESVQIHLIQAANY
ncbi:hypothetical protein I3843_04G013300 [Carya illinoinensis]|nr:hypothetical protein I3843_04G012700 [Carya illinoinensis]KAG7981754.1 hypothetical protein I3843_04G013300 [Carya illinoinensis]